ncbi:hypothetical protein BaRGS_00028975 [Batillaria attramentaria]|uniref:Uncharacterized protein n=1 Tax=Batillaria attramentaria TaxID=370345 RepID=A0ABD0JXD4_9CAEN
MAKKELILSGILFYVTVGATDVSPLPHSARADTNPIRPFDGIDTFALLVESWVEVEFEGNMTFGCSFFACDSRATNDFEFIAWGEVSMPSVVLGSSEFALFVVTVDKAEDVEQYFSNYVSQCGAGIGVPANVSVSSSKMRGCVVNAGFWTCFNVVCQLAVIFRCCGNSEESKDCLEEYCCNVANPCCQKLPATSRLRKMGPCCELCAVLISWPVWRLAKYAKRKVPRYFGNVCACETNSAGTAGNGDDEKEKRKRKEKLERDKTEAKVELVNKITEEYRKGWERANAKKEGEEDAESSKRQFVMYNNIRQMEKTVESTATVEFDMLNEVNDTKIYEIRRKIEDKIKMNHGDPDKRFDINDNPDCITM